MSPDSVLCPSCHYKKKKKTRRFLLRRVSITFTDRDGDTQTVRARLGDNLLEVAREYDIDLEGEHSHPHVS